MDVTLPSGKIIKGVPDGTPKDVIMQKAIAAGMATEADFSQASQQQPNASIGAVTGRDYSKPQQGFNADYRMKELQSLPALDGEGETGALGGFGSLFSGKNRETAITKALEDQYKDMSLKETQQFFDDFMGGRKNAIRYESETMTAFNPMEQAKIAVNINPELEIKTEKDAQGNEYPILINSRTGQASMVNEIGLDPRDATKAIGTGLLFLRGGKLKGGVGSQIVKEGARSMAIQTAIEAQHKMSGGDFDPLDIAVAGATSAGGEAVGSLLGKAYRYTKQLIGGQSDEQALKLVAQAEKAGIPLMTTDVYQPETALQKTYQLLSERIPFIGTGKMRADQMKARVDAVENLMADFAADTSEDYAPKIIESLKEANIEKMAKATAMRNSSESVLNTAGDVVPTKASAMISSELERISKSQMPDEGVLLYLEKWKEALKPANFSTIRESRSELQGKVSEMYRGQNSQIGASGAPTFTRIVGALNDDLTDFARSSGNKEAYRDWRLGNQLFRDEYIKLKGGALKNILDKGAIVPEVIRNALQESKPSQAIRLFANLTADGKANAKKMLLQDAYKKATSNATGEFSADTFATELSKKAPLFKVFFHGDDRQAVDGLTKVLQSTKRASQESALTNTGMQAGVLGGIGTGGYYAGVAPVTTLTTLLISGFGSQFLESKPMRNILIKLANTPEKSEAYGKLVTKLTQLAQPLINEDK